MVNHAQIVVGEDFGVEVEEIMHSSDPMPLIHTAIQTAIPLNISPDQHLRQNHNRTMIGLGRRPKGLFSQPIIHLGIIELIPDHSQYLMQISMAGFPVDIMLRPLTWLICRLTSRTSTAICLYIRVR